MDVYMFSLPPQSLTVSIQPGKDQKRDSVLDDSKSDRVDTVSFPCPQLSHLQTWHHVVVTMARTLRQKSKVSLFMDGMPLGVQKVQLQYIHSVLFTLKFF